MKMSTISTAIAAAAAGSSFVSASVSASSVTLSASLRSSIRVVADTAKRRTVATISSGAASMPGASRCRGSTRYTYRRSWNGLAFTSSIHHHHAPPYSSSAAQRYFTGKHYKYDNHLPWSPIIETESTSLHMTPPNYGTEGFRDAIRGSQDYIKPRGPDRDGSNREEHQQQQPAQPTSEQLQSQQQQQPAQTQHQNQPGARIPFPKLTPGRQRNYRPQHVVNTISVNSEISQQHQQYNQSQLQQQSQGAAAPPAPQPVALSTNAAAETDYCDALADPAEREHCLEDFRDGKISAGFLDVQGPTHQPHQQILQAEKDHCDALADPAKREHCLEDFRDGKISAGYLNVKGPKVDAPEAVSPQVAIEAASVMEQMSSLTDYDEDKGDDLEEPYDELRADDDELTMSQSEKFRDLSRTESKFRSGSDVDISSIDINSLLEDENEDIDVEIDSEKLSNPFKKSSFYDNPRSASAKFRDRTQRSGFKDPTFRMLEDQERELLEERESAYEELLGSRDDEDELSLESLLKDADIEEDEDISETLSDILEEQSLNDEVLSYESQLQGRGPTLEEEESTSDRESSSKSTLLSIDPQTINFLPLDKARMKEEGVSEDRASLKKSIVDSTTTLPSSISSASTTSPDIKWEDLASSGNFVKMFRGSASYIANHRGSLAVYHIPGELLAWEGFPGLMDDIALTWLLGMKIVLVAGCRHQIDLRLDDEEEGYHGESGGLGGRVMMSSIRVTDEDTLRVVKEEAGFVRFEIERRLAKSLRLHGGLVKGSESLMGNVVSGNFYSAQPFGVVDGIDYRWTGFPRKVEIERIRQVHETNDIVLLTSLGVSPSGEIFNVNSEFLAASVAGAMSASKIIYFNVHGTSFQYKSTGKPVQNLRLTDAKNLLSHYKMKIHPKGFALVDLDGDSPQQSVLRTPGSMETLIKVGYSMVALEKGVKRAHILAPENGALVQELYTRDGCGTLISRDIYEGIRRGDVNDVSGIYDLIDPLVKMGTLVERPTSQLEKEITSYYVYTRDDLIVATGQLKRYEGGFAEIGCLVVSKDYRKGGRGDAMLGYLERLSLQCGGKKVFVLSTQTMEWFVERGFREVPVESLPPSRQAQYNRKRNSKIYMKEIDGDRDLDAAELWWSNSI